MSEIVINLDSISKFYQEGVGKKRVAALINVSLSVERGEIFGFLGPNGAGKSTAIKSILNLIRPEQGSIEIMGVNSLLPRSRIPVGYLPENPYFYDYLTAEEILWFGGKSSGMNRSLIRDRSEKLLDKVGLQTAKKRRLKTYSKGMVQRAGLALALIHDPKVVILDEPMSGLDPLGRKMVVDLILELKAQGKTIFFSSHILNDVERLCDRVGIVAGGELKVCGCLSDIAGRDRSLEEVFLQTVQS